MPRDRIPFTPRTRLPTVSVEIGWSQAEEDEFKRLGIELPPASERRSNPTDALVDTGSHRSFIPGAIAERLKLARVGEGPVHQSLGGVQVVAFYAARLTIMSKSGGRWQGAIALAPTIQVGVLPNHGQGARVLPQPIIGRDVLDVCTFRYHGPEQWIEFEPPAGRRRSRFWWFGGSKFDARRG